MLFFFLTAKYIFYLTECLKGSLFSFVAQRHCLFTLAFTDSKCSASTGREGSALIKSFSRVNKKGSITKQTQPSASQNVSQFALFELRNWSRIRILANCITTKNTYTKKDENTFTSRGHSTHNLSALSVMLFNCACLFCGSHSAHSQAAWLISQIWTEDPHWDEALALTAGAAKLIGLYGLALTYPLWLPVPCLLPCPRHTWEQLRPSDTRESTFKDAPPHPNSCPEKNFNDKFHFMDPVVLLVCGCYC